MDEYDEQALRARLAAADPARGLATPDSWLPRLLEATMAQPLTDTRPDARPPRRRLVLGLAAAAAVAAVAAGVVTALDGDNPTGNVAAPKTISLTTQDNTAMQSCMPFDVAILREMPLAFAGTVTEAGSDTVTLTVDRWYRGGDAEQVRLSAPAGQNVSIDSIEFQTGQEYLVTATDGMVNYCGFTGPRTPELEAAFAEAFGG